MFDGQFVVVQLMEFLPRRDFNACVERYGGRRRERGFSCRDQFLCMGFAQLTCRESLRDIETCLRAMGPKLYHAGFRGNISQSTLADANRTHDWRIYADFAQVLIRRARQLYANEPLAIDLEQTVYALDSTTINLCLMFVSVGKVSPSQGSYQAAYVDRSAGEHPLLYSHFSRENARCDGSRPTPDRAGRLRRDGSRLCRFRTAVSLHCRCGVLCDPRQAEPRRHPTRTSLCRQEYWSARIKAFYGTSDKAVRTQLWIAISTYVLVAIVKKALRIERSLYEILPVLSLTLFEKTPIFQALTLQNLPILDPTFPNQLKLFDL